MAVTLPSLWQTLARAALWVALFVSVATPVSASPFLLSTADRPFGLSAGMGTPQVALAGGPDAAWNNPAGIARDSRTEGFLDAGGLNIQSLGIGNRTESTISVVPGSGGWANGPTRTQPRWGYAFGLHIPVWQVASSAFDEARTITGGQLPGSVAGPLPYSTLFPGGIQRREFDASSGTLQVVAPVAGAAFRVSDAFRMGAALLLERVHLRIQESFSQSFSATDNTTTANLLTGSTQSSAAYGGEANRAVLVLGVQLELGSQMVIGAVWRQPSQALGGVGQVRVNRTDSLLVTQNGATVQQATGTVHIDAASTAFALRSAGSLRLGIGFVTDSMVLEFDLEQVQAVPAYKVFPGLDSAPPSTVAARQDPLMTRANAVTRYGFATALAMGNQASWFFGFSTDPSPVAANDPIFRKVDLYQFNTGYYFTSGPFAGAVRLGYTAADAPVVRFQHLGDDDGSTQTVRLTLWSVGFSASYVF